LPAFSPVGFSGLGASPGGATSDWTDDEIGPQYQEPVSTPGTLELNGSFTVDYTGPSNLAAPVNAPAGRSQPPFVGPGGVVPPHK
jgi:hypothetical protein